MNYFRTTLIGCAFWLAAAGNLAAQYQVSLGALADTEITSSTTSVPVTLNYSGGTAGSLPGFGYAITFTVTANGVPNMRTVCFQGDSTDSCAVTAASGSQTTVQLPLSLFNGVSPAKLPVGGAKVTIAISDVNVPMQLGGAPQILKAGTTASASAQLYAPLVVTPGTPACMLAKPCSNIVVATVQGGDGVVTVSPTATFAFVQGQGIVYSPPPGQFNVAGQVPLTFTVMDSAPTPEKSSITVNVTVSNLITPVSATYSGISDTRTAAGTSINVQLMPENLPASLNSSIASGTLSINNGRACAFGATGGPCGTVDGANLLHIPLSALATGALPVGGQNVTIALTSVVSNDATEITLSPDPMASSFSVHLYDSLVVTSAGTVNCSVGQMCPAQKVGTVSGGDGTLSAMLNPAGANPANPMFTFAPIAGDATHQTIQFAGAFNTATAAGSPLSLMAMVKDSAPAPVEMQPLTFSVTVSQNSVPLTMQYTGGDVPYSQDPNAPAIQVQLVVGSGVAQGVSNGIVDGTLQINGQTCSFASTPSGDLRRAGRKPPARRSLSPQDTQSPQCGTIDPSTDILSISQSGLSAGSALKLGGVAYTITLQSADAQDPSVTFTIPATSSSVSFQLYQPLTLQAQAISCPVSQLCSKAIAKVTGGDGMLSATLAGNPSTPTVTLAPAQDGLSGSIMLSGTFTTADATPGTPAFTSTVMIGDQSGNGPLQATFGVDVTPGTANVTLSSSASSFTYAAGGSININLTVTSSLSPAPAVTGGSVSINGGSACSFTNSSTAPGPCGYISGGNLSIPMAVLPGYDTLSATGTTYQVVLVSSAGDAGVTFTAGSTPAMFTLLPGNAIQLTGGSPTLNAMVGQPVTALDLTAFVGSKGTGAGNLRFAEISDLGFTPVALATYGLTLSANGTISGSPGKATVPSTAPPYASVQVYDTGNGAVSTQGACTSDSAQCRVIHVTLGILPALTSLTPSVTKTADGSSADSTKLSPNTAYKVCLSTGSYAGTVTLTPMLTFSAPGARATGFTDPNDVFPAGSSFTISSGSPCKDIGATLNSVLAGTYTLSFMSATASDPSGAYNFPLPSQMLSNFSQTLTVAPAAPTVSCTLSAANLLLTIMGSTSTLDLTTLTINVTTPTLTNTTYTPPSPNSWKPDFATAYKQATTSLAPDGDYAMTVLVGITETGVSYKVSDFSFAGTLTNNNGSLSTPFSCSNSN